MDGDTRGLGGRFACMLLAHGIAADCDIVLLWFECLTRRYCYLKRHITPWPFGSNAAGSSEAPAAGAGASAAAETSGLIRRRPGLAEDPSYLTVKRGDKSRFSK